MKRTHLALAALAFSTFAAAAAPAAAYECTDSEAYRKGFAALNKELPFLDVRPMEVASAFLISREGISSDDATARITRRLKEENSPIFRQHKVRLDQAIKRIQENPKNSEMACQGPLEAQRERRYHGDMMIRYTLARMMAAYPPKLGEKTECRAQKTPEGQEAELCLAKAELFGHDYYTLKVDGQQVFTLAEDYIEEINLRHKHTLGTSIDFPLSLQGENETTITGGCVPEARNNVASSVNCNINWGGVQVIRNATFSFD